MTQRLLMFRTSVLLICLAFAALTVVPLQAQESSIQDFEVRENLLKNDKLAIIAVDGAGTPQEQVNGTYQFVINGFQQELQFHDGVGIAPQAIESSVFVFLKHRNQNGSTGKLFYVVKNEQGLRPIYIHWYYLIIIPLVVLLIAYLFKRLLVLALLLLVGLFIYNYSKGLNLENFFDTIVHGLKGLGGG